MPYGRIEGSSNTKAVVTGGGNGMGQNICINLAKRGCDVAFCDVNETHIKDTLEILRGINSSGTFYGAICDVRDGEKCYSFAKDVLAAFKTDYVNMLFNNAGVGGAFSIFKKEDHDAFDFILDVNFKGVVNMTRAFAEPLRASPKGALINTSSISGLQVNAGTAYSASKFAVRGFTEGLISEFAENAPNVSVYLVMPGYVATNMGVNSSTSHYRRYRGKEPSEKLLKKWTNNLADFTESNVGLSPEDAATIILNGVEEGRFDIFVGDDAVATDIAVRASRIGAIYPLTNMNIGKVSVDLAKKGDPTYYNGRQSQLKKSKL